MKVEFGDIVMVHSHSWLSLGIQFFENVSRWLGFKWKPFWAEIPNHVAMGDKNNRIIEAIEQGVFSQPINREEFLKGKKIVKIYRYPWTQMQKMAIGRVYNKSEGKPYQIVNFLQHIVYILTFNTIWLGRKGDKGGKMFCSELGSECIYEATTRNLQKRYPDSDAHVYFRDYWKISPYQMNVWVEKNCELVVTYEIKDGKVKELP